MKNTIKSTSIISVILFSLFFMSDLSAQVTLKNRSTVATNKNSLYVSPFNYINPFGPSAQLTYGRKITDHSELQLSYAHSLNYSVTKAVLNDNWDLMVDLFGYKRRGGFRIGAEHQWYSKKQQEDRGYTSVEVYYSQDKFSLFDWFFEVFDEDPIVFINKRVGLNVKKGKKIKLTERLILDTYIGIGATYITSGLSSVDNKRVVEDSTPEPGKVRMTLPMNVKLAYNF